MNRPPDDDEMGFRKFQQNLDFRRKVENPNFPESGSGMHVPLWVSQDLAHKILKQFGESGHVIPHPDIDLSDITK